MGDNYAYICLSWTLEVLKALVFTRFLYFGHIFTSIRRISWRNRAIPVLFKQARKRWTSPRFWRERKELSVLEGISSQSTWLITVTPKYHSWRRMTVGVMYGDVVMIALLPSQGIPALAWKEEKNLYPKRAFLWSAFLKCNKISWMEWKYLIGPTFSSDDVGPVIFKAREKLTFWARMCTIQKLKIAAMQLISTQSRFDKIVGRKRLWKRSVWLHDIWWKIGRPDFIEFSRYR